MTSILAILGALGGLVVFGTAIITIVRGIFRQVNATEKNTEALNSLSTVVSNIDTRIDDHAQRISRLEGRIK